MILIETHAYRMKIEDAIFIGTTNDHRAVEHKA